ncbi:MAG: CPBP family intramembrane glutamic endopeptidase [Flavobacteriaceae bacterium]|nr:CPBP family intramembrane metalloprotease [Flavobacteriaceae bacterium]
MYIASAYNVLHDYWRYLIGVGVAIAGIFVFSIPHLIAVFMKTFDGSADMSKLDDTNYLMTLFEPNLNLVFILLPFAGGLLFLLLIAKVLHKQSFKQLTTSRDKIDWSRFWFALVFWGIISSSLIAVDYFSNPEHYQNNFNLQPFLILCVIAVILVPLQTSFEEYFFRGYLMQGIGVLAKNKWVPLFVTSVIFGLLHIANPEIEKLGYILLVYYISTGLLFGIMTLMDDGLELALGFHLANNLFTALLVTADWTAFQTHSIFKDVSEPTAAGFIDVFLPVFVIFPLVLFVFAKKYKWTNWKEKLFGRVEKPVEDYKILED